MVSAVSDAAEGKDAVEPVVVARADDEGAGDVEDSAALPAAATPPAGTVATGLC